MSTNLKGGAMGRTPGHMIVLDVKGDDVFDILFRSMLRIRRLCSTIASSFGISHTLVAFVT